MTMSANTGLVTYLPIVPTLWEPIFAPVARATPGTATNAQISTNVPTPFWPQNAWKTQSVATFPPISCASVKQASKAMAKSNAEISMSA